MNQYWEYASIIEIFIYLVNNTRPDIAHVVVMPVHNTPLITQRN